MKLIDPYRGRVRPKPSSSKGGIQSLRKPSRQPDGTLPQSAKGSFGDVSDPYLRGQAGGESHPFYDKHKSGRR
jgi:hypothetical protein